MAVTWSTTITVIDFDRKRIAVTGTRTDDAIPETTVYGPVRVTVDMGDLAGTRDKIVSALQNLRNEDVSETTNKDSLLNGWENALNSALDAWEIE